MIGIITINDNNNYGNRLQNLATYFLLSKYDKTVNIVRHYGCEFKRFPDRKHYYLAKIYHFVKDTVFYFFHFKRYLIRRRRKKNFTRFNKCIRSGPKIGYKTKLTTLNKTFDLFVVGSDQVWNPNINGNGMYINMLGFCNDGNKKISLAASISQDSLTEAQINEFKNYLNDFKCISCREKQGSILLKSILNREIETLVDPTLVLKKEEWDCYCKKPSFLKKESKFMFVYLLGKKTNKYKEIINYYQTTLGLEVYEIMDELSTVFSSGPSEFLWLIKNSSFVITDSYHGTVFSCIYEKPFKILKRIGGEDMNSRLINLKNVLEIDDCSFIDESNYKQRPFDSVWNKEKLKVERARFYSYLDKYIPKAV